MRESESGNTINNTVNRVICEETVKGTYTRKPCYLRENRAMPL